VPDTKPVTDILLATDLGPRCDRALLQASFLASHWGARLHLLLVVEPSTRPTWEDDVVVERAKAEVRGIIGDTSADWRMIVRRGVVDEAVNEVARDTGCQLIMVGMAVNEFLGRAKPGRLVEVLIRRSTVPVLMVKKPRTEQYRRLLAPTDFSAVSEAAILRAMTLFPGASLSLLHAYRVPFAGFLGEATANEVREAASAETQAFAGSLASKASFETSPTVRLEQGSPEVLVQNLTRSGAVDLTVIGVHPTWGLHRHSGNLAARLLIASATDVLAVPEAA